MSKHVVTRKKTVRRVAVYSGPVPADSQTYWTWSEVFEAERFADRRRNVWDFDTAVRFLDTRETCRRERDRLMQAIANREFTDVIAFEQNRVAETEEEFNAIKNFSKQNGVTFHLAKKPLCKPQPSEPGVAT